MIEAILPLRRILLSDEIELILSESSVITVDSRATEGSFPG